MKRKPEKFLKDFSERLNTALDLMDPPAPGRGRCSWLAKKFGISRNAAHKWLHGKARPEYDRMREIADALNVPAPWLFFGEGPSHLPPDLIPRIVTLLREHFPDESEQHIAHAAHVFWEQEYKALFGRPVSADRRA
jgi:transcriptional regulator with XRE-family HTH domain